MTSWIFAIWSTSLDPGNNGCKLEKQTMEVNWKNDFIMSIDQYRQDKIIAVRSHKLSPFTVDEVLRFFLFTCLAIRLSFRLAVCHTTNMSVCLCMCLSVTITIHVCMYFCLHFCLSVCLLPHNLEEDAADAPDVHLVRVVTVRQ